MIINIIIKYHYDYLVQVVTADRQIKMVVYTCVVHFVFRFFLNISRFNGVKTSSMRCKIELSSFSIFTFVPR